MALITFCGVASCSLTGIWQWALGWPDDMTMDRVVAVLDSMETIILELRAARVWPWAGARAAQQAMQSKKLNSSGEYGKGSTHA